MRKFLVSVIVSGCAVLAAVLAPAPAAAAPLPAPAAVSQDAAMAPGRATLAGVRHRYGNGYYLPYCGRRPCCRRCNGYRPYYPGYYYGYYPYYAPLTICGTMLCYQPRFFIAPAW